MFSTVPIDPRQIKLLEVPAAPVVTQADKDFIAFHFANPRVYETLVKLARQAVVRGHKRVGMKMLWEVMRWEHLLATVEADESGYKFNNNLHSRYARLIMANEADLAGIFETRRLKT